MKGGGPSEEAERDGVGGRPHLLAGIGRRWSWVAWPAAAAMLASSAFVFLTGPGYTGVAKVLLGDRAAGAVESQAEAVATPDLARKAIERLALAGNPEFSPGCDGKIDPSVVDTFLSRLTVLPLPRSGVFEIEFVSADPELAARGANAVAEVYVQSQAEARASAARTAEAMQSRKIEELRAKVADADAKVEAFRAESRPAAGANGQTVLSREPSELDAELANARSAEAAATAKSEILRRLDQQGRLNQAPESISDPSLRHLIEQRAAVRAEIADAPRTLPPPRMKELSAELAGLDGQVRGAVAKTLRGLDNDARLAGDQIASLSAALEREPAPVATPNADDIPLRGLDGDPDLRALEMDAKGARDELEFYLRTVVEARDRDSGATAAARVIEAAEPPRQPTFPKVWQTIVLATLGAFAVSSGFVAVAAFASDRKRASARTIALSDLLAPVVDAAASAQTSREEPRLPELPAPVQSAEVPAELATSFEGTNAAASETAAAAEALADRLTRSLTPRGRLAALIAGNGSGRALTLALETARRLSAEGSALLVDLGETQDWFADMLQREDTVSAEVPGLADLLAGRAGFGEVIRRDLSSSLDVIASGGDAAGETLEDVFAALTSAYGRVVFHASDWRSPPARLAAQFADTVVLVAPAVVLRRIADEAQKTLGAVRIVRFAVPRPQPAMGEAA